MYSCSPCFLLLERIDIGFYANPKKVTVSFSNDEVGPILTVNVLNPKRQGIILNIYFPVCCKNRLI